MSVRQYIGARYVPRFSDVNGGNWSSVYAYEPLTIVKNGNDYYTSKKSVPVGIQITNTEYWQKTGDYNGAISTLDTRLTSAENSISDIEEKIDLSSKNFWLIGDSFLEASSSWDEAFETLIGKSCYKTGEGGIGVCNPGNTSGLNLSQKILALSDVPNNITDVIIMCGTNDCKSTYLSSYRAAFNSMIAAVRSKAGSDVNITFAFMTTYYATSSPYFADAQAVMGHMLQFSKVLCNENKIAFTDAPLYQAQYRTFITDGVHLTEQGYQTIAYCLYNFVVFGEHRTIPYVIKHGNFFFDCCEKYVTIHAPNGTVIYDGASRTFAAGTYGDPIATGNIPVMPKSNYQFTLPVFVAVSGSRYAYGCVTFYQDGRVFFMSSTTLENVTSLQVLAGCNGTFNLFEQLDVS